MTWTDLQRTRVDVLEIYSSEKISVRLRSMREEYFKFQDSLMIYCSENLDYLQRLQPDQLNNINKFPSLKENCIRVVGPQLRSLQESQIRGLDLPRVLMDQLLDYRRKEEQYYHTEAEIKAWGLSYRLTLQGFLSFYNFSTEDILMKVPFSRISSAVKVYK